MFGAPMQPKTMKQRVKTMVNPTTAQERQLRDSYLISGGVFLATTLTIVVWRTKISKMLEEMAGV